MGFFLGGVGGGWGEGGGGDEGGLCKQGTYNSRLSKELDNGFD